MASQQCMDHPSCLFTCCTINLNPTEIPPFLGGVHGQQENHGIPSSDDSVYGSLPRRSLVDLPGVHSRDSFFWDLQLEETYQKLYHGDFSAIEITILEATSKTPPGMGETTTDKTMIYKIEAIMEGFDEMSPLVLSFVSRKGHGPAILHHTGSESFQQALTEGQKVAIQLRFLHLMLRTHGIYLDWPIFQGLCLMLETEYLRLNWLEEALDLSMIRADVTFNKNLDAKWKAADLLYVGEFLEGLRMFEKASLLYQEILTHFWDANIQNLDRATLYNFAAMAIKRSGNFARAEELYLHAMHEDMNIVGTPWDKTLIVLNVETLYLDWVEQEYLKWDFIEILFALFVVAEAKSTRAQKSLEDMYFRRIQGNDVAFALLKPQYHTQKMAQQVLDIAISIDDNVEHFYSCIIQCSSAIPDGLPTDQVAKFVRGAKYFRKHTFKNDQKKVAKQANPINAADYSVCGFCQAIFLTQNLKFCPCHTISYCGKECQIADWPKHKFHCPKHQQGKASSVGTEMVESPCGSCKALLLTKDLKDCPCRTISYCSTECQTADWQRHKLDCPKYQGRKAKHVTKKKIDASPDYSPCGCCNALFLSKDLKECHCQTISYCGTECQTADWPSHRLHCPKYQARKAPQLTTKKVESPNLSPCGCCKALFLTTDLKSCHCRTTSYCGTKCQTADWPKHRLYCPKYQARKAQQHITQEKVETSDQSHCGCCKILFLTKDLKDCHCRTISYCGKECQTADWPRHKLECPKYQAEKTRQIMKEKESHLVAPA